MVQHFFFFIRLDLRLGSGREGLDHVVAHRPISVGFAIETRDVQRLLRFPLFSSTSFHFSC